MAPQRTVTGLHDSHLVGPPWTRGALRARLQRQQGDSGWPGGDVGASRAASGRAGGSTGAAETSCHRKWSPRSPPRRCGTDGPHRIVLHKKMCDGAGQQGPWRVAGARQAPQPVSW